jgi:hypothetical protein
MGHHKYHVCLAFLSVYIKDVIKEEMQKQLYNKPICYYNMLLRSVNMVKKIRIKVGAIEAAAELNNTRTAQAIWEALPIKARVNLWGKEVYFSIPVSLELEAGQELVSAGDLGYWPEGSAFCIFFGPTPISRGNEIRPASAVTVFGRITGDATIFKQVASGAQVIIEK